MFFAITVFLIMLGLNSIFSTAGGALAITAIITILRKDLLISAHWSGLFACILMFIFYLVIFWAVGNGESIFNQPIWLLDGTCLGIKLLGVSFTELLWGFCAGSALGIVYPFVRDLHYVHSVQYES
jgi:hypothetical protein